MNRIENSSGGWEADADADAMPCRACPRCALLPARSLGGITTQYIFPVDDGRGM